MKVSTGSDAQGAVMNIVLRDEHEALQLIAALAKTLAGVQASGTFKDDAVTYQRIVFRVNRT